MHGVQKQGTSRMRIPKIRQNPKRFVNELC
jgi:hypothetical protein